MGAVTEDDGALADPEACSWRLNDQPVLQGIDGWIVAPEPGEHRCTLAVRGRGGPAEVEVMLRTVDAAEADPRLGGTPEPKGSDVPRCGVVVGAGVVLESWAAPRPARDSASRRVLWASTAHLV